MKKITDIFKQYKTIIRKPAAEHSPADKAIIAFVSYIRDFFIMYDLYENINHARLFDLLFLNKRKLSCESIALKTFVSVKTLYRFKKKSLSFISDMLQSGFPCEEKGQIMSVFRL